MKPLSERLVGLKATEKKVEQILINLNLFLLKEEGSNVTFSNFLRKRVLTPAQLYKGIDEKYIPKGIKSATLSTPEKVEAFKDYIDDINEDYVDLVTELELIEKDYEFVNESYEFANADGDGEDIEEAMDDIEDLEDDIEELEDEFFAAFGFFEAKGKGRRRREEKRRKRAEAKRKRAEKKAKRLRAKAAKAKKGKRAKRLRERAAKALKMAADRRKRIEARIKFKKDKINAKESCKKKFGKKDWRKKCFKGIKKGLKKGKRDKIRAAGGTGIGRVVRKLNKFNPLFVGMRNAFAIIVRLNIFGFATRLDATKKAGGRKWMLVKRRWENFGGRVKSLEKWAKKGKKKKPILTGKKFKGKFKFEGGYYNLTEEGAILLASSIVTALAGLVGASIDKKKEKEIEEAAKEQMDDYAEDEGLTPEEKEEMEKELGVSDVDDDDDAEPEEGKKILGMPATVVYVGGGLAVLGVIIAVIAIARKAAQKKQEQQ